MGPLADAHRVIWYDRRGFANSERRFAHRLSDHVDDAIELLRLRHAAPVTIVGMSGAGPIALALAALRPDLVSGLILAEPAYRLALTPSLSAGRAIGTTATRALLRRDPDAAVLGFYRWASAYETGGNGYDGLPKEWRETAMGHASAVFRELAQLTRPWPRARAVRRLRCPVTLVITDNGQPVFRRTTHGVHRLLPGARLVKIPGAGHLIPLDKPAEFGAAVREAIAVGGTGAL